LLFICSSSHPLLSLSFNSRFCSSLRASRSLHLCSSLLALAINFFFSSNNRFISTSSLSMLIRCWTAARSCSDALDDKFAADPVLEFRLLLLLLLVEDVLMMVFPGCRGLFALLEGRLLALGATRRGPLLRLCCCWPCCPIAIRYSSAEQSPYSLRAMGEGAASPFWAARVRSMLFRTVTAMKLALKFS